jgi:cell division protein FtsI (penicillin-binding protein 3)
VAAPAFKEIADRVYATKIKGLIETEPLTIRDAEYHYDTNPILYDPMRVPNVQGMNISDAVYLLENMGWTTTFEGYGQVVHQSVPAGDSLRPGGLIELTLEKK